MLHDSVTPKMTSRKRPSLDFWFEFASPYSYIAAARLPALCEAAGVDLAWRPFLLGPIFELQGWHTSHFNLNERRSAYMWRDMERLCEKFGLPWRRPSVFPRNAVLAARVAAAHSTATWIQDFVRRCYHANFVDDADLNDERVIRSILAELLQSADERLNAALTTELRTAIRRNTDRAIALGIFGAPNCTVGNELFWGEEALEDAIAWAQRTASLETTHLPAPTTLEIAAPSTVETSR